jgi:hypothetical protein
MFQAVLTVDSDGEDDSTPLALVPPPGPAQDTTLNDESADNEEREYYTEVIDGVRSLRYSVVVPPDDPPASLDLAQQGNSDNANEPHVQPTQHDSRWGENTRTTGMETPANPSSSEDPYPWGEGTFEPTWGTWRTRPAPDPSWGGTTQRWERKEREKVITRGGSPPPKLEFETNLFHDDRNQRVPQTNRTASDDLAFQVGKQKDGIVKNNARHNIPTHPNPFDVLSEPHLPYHDFIPGTDTEDDDKPTDPLPTAQPKTPKRTRKKPSRRRSSKAANSENDDDLTDDERDLSMYRLSDEDSDSSLTIYYKAYNNNKPEMNESSSESTERTQRIEEEVARMKEARKRKQEKKKRQRTAKRQRPRYSDIKPVIKRYHSDSDDEDAQPLHFNHLEAY